MRILSIGTDPRIFDSASPSAARMKTYGDLAERYDIIARARRGQKDFDLARNVRVYAARAPLPALFLFSALLAAYRARRRGRFDVVTAENPFDVGLVAWIVARIFGAAFHLQVHGDFFGSREWRKERASNRLRFFVAKFLACRADGFRVVSERIKKSLVALGIVPDKIIVSPIMEDTRALSAACMGIQKSPHPLVLFVGRFETEKNPLLLVQAFAEVIKQIPSARLRLVGEGALRTAIEQKIVALGIASSVEILPWTSDLAPHYAAAHVLAIPSNHEGWGRVAVEAAACGLPVIMTDVGCAGEFVKDGESGWVAPVGDVRAFAVALTEALIRGDEARSRAEALYARCALLVREPQGELRRSWLQSYETSVK